MAISIPSLNDGQPRSMPYGKVTQIPPSFSDVDYYDCYIPYALTVEQLGGYATNSYYDGVSKYGPMPSIVRSKPVANRVQWENNGEHKVLRSEIEKRTITKKYDDYGCSVIEDKNGVQFYETAIQDFFLRGTVISQGPNGAVNSYFGRTSSMIGQIFDIILTDGTVIHFVASDVNASGHTNCGPNSQIEFAPCSYDQYHNIVSNIGGNCLEMRAESGNAVAQWANFFNLGLYSSIGSNNIAFYRVYKAKVQTGVTVANDAYKKSSYNVNGGGSSIPATQTVDPTPAASTTTTPQYSLDDSNIGIRDLKVDFEIWKRETKLRKLGEYVTLKAAKNLQGVIVWTEKETKRTYSKAELKNHFGISYSSVNDGYEAKFEVVKAPLSIEEGGTGSYDLNDLYQAIVGVNPGPYDTSSLPTYSASTTKIDLPIIPEGHIITAEARSEERGTVKVGDQGQQSADTLDIEMAEYGIVKSGEVSFVYDRPISFFTHVYRLMDPDNAENNTKCKLTALAAANHACFMCQNPVVGYNFYANNQAALWNYIVECRKNNLDMKFGNITTPGDTNCINLCRLAYASVMLDLSDRANYANLSKIWTTAGILSSRTLESLGFKKFDLGRANVANSLEIGDIIIKNGHAAMIVAVGHKDWKIGTLDLNPKNGEVLKLQYNAGGN